MKKLIATVAAIATIFPMPAFAGSWKDINELSRLVRATGTEIVAKKCSENIYGSYHYDDKRDIDRLTICTNRVDMDDPDAVWETLAHEATHVAQACNGSNVYKDTYLPRVFRALRAEAPHYVTLLDNSYDNTDRIVEAEAFYMELQEPEKVKRMMVHICEISEDDYDAMSWQH